MAVRTKQELLDVLGRTMDSGWLDPIIADADASAPINAAADVLAALSIDAQEACDNTTISGSAAGRGGSSVVTLSRTASGSSGTIPAGYAFVDARGLVAIAVADTTVGAGVTTVDVIVATRRKTELVDTVNDPLFTIGPNLAVLDGGATNALIGQSPAPSGYPPIVSTTFTTVASSTPITGGASDWLAAVGRERGQLRQAAESDGAFRLRVRNVPDAVSPTAVTQAVEGAASHVGLPPPTIFEPFNLGISAQALADAQLDWFDSVFFSGTIDNFGNFDPFSPKVDFLEDIQPDLLNLKPREMVSLREARCYFRVVLPGPVPDPDDGRMFLNDAFFDDPILGFPDIHDDSKLLSALMAVWEEANRKRAAGVRFDEYLDATVRVSGVGATSAGTEQTVFTITPPVGAIWLLMDGHFGWDAQFPVAATGRLKFTFDDASTYTTPADPNPWGQRVNGLDVFGTDPTVRRITQIDGLLTSNGVIQANLVGNLFFILAAP